MPRDGVMRHFLEGGNLGLMLTRQVKSSASYQHVFITNEIFESSLVSNKTSEIGYGFPLYLYPDEKQQHIEKFRIPNLDKTIIASIENRLGLRFTPEKQEDETSFTPVDILDYIYAVLHSPSYRERYKEFLKTGFPMVPYPDDRALFHQLVRLGGEVRALHLLEHPVCDTPITGYNVSGGNKMGKAEYRSKYSDSLTGNVYINKDDDEKQQCFENVPKVAWEFCIGGYQPAQKWLKDRKGRTLNFDDISHYQRMIVALKETNEIMLKIDEILLAYKVIES